MAEQQAERETTGAPGRGWAATSASPAGRPVASAGDVDDGQLIARIVAGDRDAFAALYDRNARAVFGLLNRVVGERPVAEELVQETFLRVWQHAPSFDPARGTPAGWMLGIAHNLGLNEHRRRRSRPVISPPITDDVLDPRIARVAGDEPDPADEAIRLERLATVATALADLPEVQRDVIQLYAVGHTQEEIAARLDAPLGTVKTRMRRGLLRLRVTLSDGEVRS